MSQRHNKRECWCGINHGRVSTLLEAVSAAREARDAAQRAYREAVRRARETYIDPETGKPTRHSLSELARAAGVTRSGVQHLLRSRGDTEK